MWPSMTSEIKLHWIKNLRLYNVSICINLYQNQVINIYKKVKIPVLRKDRVFFARCRTTYVVKI